MSSIKFFLIATVVFISPPAYAESSLGAHLHGHVEFNVAADGKKLFVEVHSPSESFLGFEHRPQTDQQKALWTSVKNQWEKKTHELIQIDPSLSCVVTQAHMDMHFEEDAEHPHDDHDHEGPGKDHGEDSQHESGYHGHEAAHDHGEGEPLMGGHSEVKAEAMFSCRKEIADSQLVILLKKHFPNIEQIEAQVLPNSNFPYSKTLTEERAVLDL